MYYKAEKELHEAFKASPSNDGVIDKRVRKLNSYYSTRIPHEVMIEIENLYSEDKRFEEKIREGNVAPLKLIAKANATGKNYFVFATKYCALVEPNKYHIFDRLVVEMLKKYIKLEESSINNNEKINFETIRNNLDYGKYKGIIDDFKKYYNLTKCSYREIDKYLWTMDDR